MDTLILVMLACATGYVSMVTGSYHAANSVHHDKNIQYGCSTEEQYRTIRARLKGWMECVTKSLYEVVATRLLPLRSGSSSELVRPERSAEDSHNHSPEIKVQQMESNQSSFEVYERRYLIQQTLLYLKSKSHVSFENHLSTYKQNQSALNEPTATSRRPGHLDQSTESVNQSSGNQGNPSTDSRETNRINMMDAWNQMNELSIPKLQQIFQNASMLISPKAQIVPLSSICCPHG